MAIIDLTTTARVKELLDVPSADTGRDAAIARLVTGVSRRIEQYLNRPVESAARTEYLDVAVDRCSYQLAASPVTTLTSVKNSATFAWADVTAKTEGTDFVLDPQTGILRQLTYWVAGPEALQVVYTAGLAANTAAVLTDHPDLADACEKQVVEEWQRRLSLSRTSSAASGTTEAHAAVSLLAVVREALAPYRRPTW